MEGEQGPVLVNHVSGFKLKLAVGMPASREGLTLELLAFPCSAFSGVTRIRGFISSALEVCRTVPTHTGAE